MSKLGKGPIYFTQSYLLKGLYLVLTLLQTSFVTLKKSCGKR